MVQRVQSCLQALHSGQNCGIEGFDVTIFGHVRFCTPQDALNNFLVCTQFIQIRRNATPEAMSAIPIHPNAFYEWTDNLQSQLVQVHRITVTGVKHQSGCRTSHGHPIRP